MVSEPFRSYPSEYLLGLSGQLLSLSAWGGCFGDPTSIASVCWLIRPPTIGPPIICYPMHELSFSAWGGCVGDPTSTRDEDNSLYISGCKPDLHEPVLWGWVRLKVHFVIWYQSHFDPILASICWVYQANCCHSRREGGCFGDPTSIASVCWAYQATRYRVVIGPPIICYPMHELSFSAWGGVLEISHRLEMRTIHCI